MRAWVIHCISTAWKLMKWVSGKSIWLSKPQPCVTEKSEDCVARYYNQNFFDEIQPNLQIMCIVLIVVEVIICIGSYKWRKLTHLIIYVEIIY